MVELCFRVVYAFMKEKSAHRSETKITDKCFRILFLIFLHYISHENSINYGIKCRGHGKKSNSLYNRNGRLNM